MKPVMRHDGFFPIGGSPKTGRPNLARADHGCSHVGFLIYKKVVALAKARKHLHALKR